MQDIHSLKGGGPPAAAERLFAAVTGDRRLLRPTNQALKCPRCDSLNTKFCYYNNYNHSQPRHFCKSCRRYWTNGGVLRNVPVGGGCRKSKRSSSSSRSSSSKPPPPPLPSISASKSLADDPADATKAAAAHSSAIPTLFQEMRATTALSLYGVDERGDVGSGMLSFTSGMGSTGQFGDTGMMSQQGEEMVDVEEFGALDWEGKLEVEDEGYWSQLNQWTVADDVLDDDDHHPGGGGGIFLP